VTLLSGFSLVQAVRERPPKIGEKEKRGETERSVATIKGGENPPMSSHNQKTQYYPPNFTMEKNKRFGSLTILKEAREEKSRLKGKGGEGGKEGRIEKTGSSFNSSASIQKGESRLAKKNKQID